MVIDSLAANSIGGSFNNTVSGYCRQCLVDAESVQIFFRDHDFQARTKETNKDDLETFQQLAKKQKTLTHINGVKGKCCFDILNFFSIINGLPPDLLYDWLKGNAPKKISILLKYLIENGQYSIEEQIILISIMNV